MKIYLLKRILWVRFFVILEYHLKLTVMETSKTAVQKVHEVHYSHNRKNDFKATQWKNTPLCNLAEVQRFDIRWENDLPVMVVVFYSFLEAESFTKFMNS